MNVILHIFSNSIEYNLSTLEVERQEVLAILNERAGKGEYEYAQLNETGIEAINTALRKYENDLIAFQFSGHAGEESVLINDIEINANGIAMQLEESARRGVLKLVVLNGCATSGLAEKLKQKSVPAVVSTNAPSGDESSTTFSIHFWRNLITYNMSIEKAFYKAIGPAQTVTKQSIESTTRKDEALPVAVPALPVWRLDGQAEAIRINPVHIIYGAVLKEFTTNSILFPSLFKDFFDAQNEEVMRLTNTASRSARMTAMINSMPHPIATHLQKLFSPLESSPEGYDRITLKRLEQIGQLYDNAAEFLCYIMVSQLWEIMLNFHGIKNQIPRAIRDPLNQFFILKPETRETFHYIRLMQIILRFIQQLNGDPHYKDFVDRQSIYKDFLFMGDEFYKACEYLHPLRVNTYEGSVIEKNLEYVSETAERKLYEFLKPLAFMHRYKLASIQHIDVVKLRHTKQWLTRYKHKLTFLMNSKGGEEESFYYMKSFIDNWSVILIKDEKRRKANKAEEPTFVSIFVDFLNLSPFVIDQNVYLKNTNLSDIMFFRGFDPKGTGYKRVSNTLDKKDILILPMHDNYAPIMKQMKNFKNIVLG